MVHKGFRIAGLGPFSAIMSAETPTQPDRPSLPPPPPPPPWLQLVEQGQPSSAAPKGEASAAQPPAAAAAPAATQIPAPAAAAAPPVPQVAEKKVREYRYMTRILKSMFLPLLFGVMSFLMLNNYVNGFEPYYKYDFQIIALGFLLGLAAMNGFVLYNMRTAKREGRSATRQLSGLIILMAFLVPYLYYILLVNPANAWRFSIGFFLSAVVTPIIVKAYESYARGKFFIQEEEVDDRLTRTLVFRS